MATSHFSISRFFGAKYGAADNLISLGYAAEAVNVDTSDGALQTIVGCIRYPKTPNGFVFDPHLMWEDAEQGAMLFIADNKIVQVYPSVEDPGVDTQADVVYTPTAEEQAKLATVYRIFLTTIDGERVAIGLRKEGLGPGTPVVIGYENNNFYVRDFGTGMFLTSDEITEVDTDTDSRIVGVKINRLMTDPEVTRCLLAGVYIMEHETDELDFTAAYVSDCVPDASMNKTVITFLDPLIAGSVQVGNYVKVRGGLSDQPVKLMCTFYGRLFAAGDPSFPNRLYWSCLPGDGRTIEDWTADDASPDTGGGYVQVGGYGLISALFVYESQLLIWKGNELWRLYGATPSQYTLERVFRGTRPEPNRDSEMQYRIADVHGAPYFLLDDGLYTYNGSGLSRVDADEGLQRFLRQDTGRRVDYYTADLFSGVSGVDECSFYNGCLYFVGSTLAYPGRQNVLKYDLRTGAITSFDAYLYCYATTQGVLVCGGAGASRSKSLYLLLDEYNMCSPNLTGAQHDPTVALGDLPWEDVYHYLPGPDDERLPINAVWESRDLSLGEISYFKRLKRIGLDVTGPVRVIISTPEGGRIFDTVYSMTDHRERRFLWIAPEMPYDSSFRVRFESVSGFPFRIHNGVDFYIETNTRN